MSRPNTPITTVSGALHPGYTIGIRGGNAKSDVCKYKETDNSAGICIHALFLMCYLFYALFTCIVTDLEAQIRTDWL